MSVQYIDSNSHFNFRRVSSKAEYHFTERLAMRPLTLSDAWPVWNACQVPAFTANLLWAAPSEPAEMFDRVEAILSEVRRNKMIAASLVVRETGEWVGLARYFPSYIDNTPNSIEGGIWLHPKFWSGKLGLEIGSLMAGAVFVEDSALQSIVARTSKENRAANALLKDLGFTAFGEGVTNREDGSEMQILHYQMTRAAWAQRSLKSSSTVRGQQWLEAA